MSAIDLNDLELFVLIVEHAGFPGVSFLPYRNVLVPLARFFSVHLTARRTGPRAPSDCARDEQAQEERWRLSAPSTAKG